MNDISLTSAQRIFRIAVFVLMALGVVLVWDVVADDAFITMRYSEHLAHGAGPVWNVGEDPVQGYTNFAWMILLAVASALGLNMLVAAKCLGAFAFFGAGALIVRAVQTQTRDPFAANVALLAHALFLSAYVHAVAGLETMFYAACVAGIAACALERKVVGAVAFGLCATFARPEGAAVIGAALGWLLLREPALRKRVIVMGALGLALPGIALILWQKTYYGSIVPNTFFVKVVEGASGLTEWPVRALAVTALPLAFSAVRAKNVGWLEASLVPLMFFAGSIAYATSNLTMNYGYRFLYHLFPLICVMAGLGFATVSERYASMRYAIAAVLVLGMTGLPNRAVQPNLLLMGEDLTHAHSAFGKALRDSGVPAAERSLAIGDAGALPYFADWRAADFVGLNDEAIAHGVAPTERLLALSPTMIILYSADGQTPRPFQYRVDPAALSAWEPITAVPFHEGTWLLPYVKRNASPEARAEIERAVQRVRADASTEHTSWSRWWKVVKRRFGA